MVRKLISAGALVFALSVAVLSKPAFAAPPCDCEFCAASPNSQCIDDDHGGWRRTCLEFKTFFC